MDLHRVRRLGWVLVASQVRSGARSANPKGFLNQPGIFAWAAVGLLVGVFLLASLALDALTLPRALLGSVVVAAVPFLPLLAVATVLVGGVMFELTATVRFAGSDAANWLPLRPEEYVLASSLAVAYTYCLPLALLLGAFAAIAVHVGAGALIALSGVLSAVGLLEGAFLVEMVRSTSQRAGSTSGARGRVALVLRALALVIMIIALQLVFNPVFLFASLRGLATFGQFTAYLPPFWGTFAVLAWSSGNVAVAAAFALLAAAFAGLLLCAATVLRVRYWSVTAEEFRLEPHRYAAGHPLLRALGLSPAEAAIVTKDFHGYVRRREMLPLLVLPIVLLVIVFIENATSSAGFGTFGIVVFTAWATSFFALLLATTSVGQERKAITAVLASPVPAASLFRAKLVASVAPAWVASVVIAVLVGLLFHVGLGVVLGLMLTSVVAGFVVALWGLAFAARYSDFQERPRPQYLRPGPMLAATGSGILLVFVVVVPATVALLSTGTAALEGAGFAAAVALTVVALTWGWARQGFEALFREVPF
ncbi:MAG TPA: hypothetical protein VMI55_06210 [Thermoplasmata archaeon]|nr:hypothetical protein [Thermoplasmata archaeon]